MTRLLLDTHTVLWSIGDTDRLSPLARDLIGTGAHPAFVSAASVWEIAIKRASGKLTAPDELMVKVGEAGFRELAISFDHATLAGALPLHHADPFDRMLVAQAQSEGLTLVSGDPKMAAYEVPVLW